MISDEDQSDAKTDRELADDLLMDAILEGHHQDERHAVDARVRRVMLDVNALPDRSGEPATKQAHLSHRLARRGWGVAIAAAVLMAAGLTTMLMISTTPTAVAGLDQTLRLMERGDLTFRLELTREKKAGLSAVDRRFPQQRDRPPRHLGRSGPPLEQFNGAALHIRGPKYVLLGDRDRASGLAKGFDGTTHWTNGPKQAPRDENPRSRGPLLDEFFEFTTLDVPELIRDLRRSYDVEIIEIESTPSPDGFDRNLVHYRADRREGTRAGLPVQIDLWTDADTGRLEAMDCSGVQLRGPESTYEVSLTLQSDAQLPEEWFDRDSHLPEHNRGGHRPRDLDKPGFHVPFPPPHRNEEKGGRPPRRPDRNR
ncbi:MAG: hypothetical protein CBB69_013210 [Phycisphaera sp. TMED9]|nr:MAG: hypothetical protein CBB69_013210 [Phycisphaera sp. TMED9]